MLSWGISKITFSGGEEISLDQGSILIIIGPNSSGKSSAIREMHAQLHGPQQPSHVVQSIRHCGKGTLEELRAWFDENLGQQVVIGVKHYHGINVQVREESIPDILRDNFASEPKVHGAPPYFFTKLDADYRLQVGNTQAAMDLNSNDPKAPIHLLQLRPDLLNRLTKDFKEAFGKDLIINWGGGSHVWFHVGIQPKMNRKKEDRVDPEYLRRLNELPRLEQEGDGVRSYVGSILAASCGSPLLLFIDEPEAFLHPRQAERLGGLLASTAETRNRQVIVATHSSAFLRGAITKSRKVAVCRLTRDGNINHAALLSSSDLKDVLSKPLLRSASAVEGVFYSGVVVCEGDADARFYEAILSRLEATGQFARPTDVYFVSAGGKGELDTLAKVYNSLQVPIVVIADLDLLRNKSEFTKVVQSLGGDFTSLESHYSKVVASLNDLPPIKSFGDFLSETDKLLKQIKKKGSMTSTDRIALSDLMSESATWSTAKSQGINKLRGGAYKDAEDFLAKCASMGIFLVPTGELESWWRGGSANKVEWFTSAIESIHTNPTTFREASDFILRIAKHLGAIAK